MAGAVRRPDLWGLWPDVGLMLALPRLFSLLRGGDDKALDDLGPRFDLVLVDAPCTGTGTWRRRPDAKWRLKPQSVAERQSEQREVLTRAARLVKPGGTIAFITCSILPGENTEQVGWFLETHAGFSVIPVQGLWQDRLGTDFPGSANGSSDTLLLTPAFHGTDGFFLALLKKG